MKTLASSKEEKLKILQSVKDGIPLRFALHPEKYRFLYGNQMTQKSGYFVTRDGEQITVEDQERYFPQAIIYMNISAQFPDYLVIANDQQ